MYYYYILSKSFSSTLVPQDVVQEPETSTSGSTRPESVVEELDTELPQTRSEQEVEYASIEESVTDRASFSAETESSTSSHSRLALSKSGTCINAPLPLPAGTSTGTSPMLVQSDTGTNIAMPQKPVQSRTGSITVTPLSPSNAGTSDNPLSESNVPVTKIHMPIPAELSESNAPETGKATQSPQSNPERKHKALSSLPP